MKHILVLNCFEENNYREDFNTSIKRCLTDAHCSITTIYGEDLYLTFDINSYTHLIISGSLASAYEEKPWNNTTENLIRQWVSEKKPLLGICYGHQFLARTLTGTHHVRKSSRPEFGWATIELKKHPLFNNTSSIVSFVSHYDEVHGLNSEFNILAHSDLCGVHAFQYKDLPVFGIQFHPEYEKKTAGILLKDALKSNPELEHHLINNPVNNAQLDSNKKFIVNFVSIY